jgi:CheY-like chemotaxis protein
MDGPMETIRVLIVSDNPADVTLIENLLQIPNGDAKYYVEATDDFQRALRALVSSTHDVYLVDYHVPGAGITGIDLIQRAYAGGCTSPIILLTQITDESIYWAAEAAGAADVLHKHADLCPHPDCPMHRSTDTPQRLLTRAIHYAIRHFQQLRIIEKQLDAVQKQLADVHRKLNRG